MSKYFIFISFVFILLFNSCKSKPEESRPTFGEIKILVDENLRNIIEQEKDIFERQYPFTKITLDFAPENEVVHKFLNMDSEIIIINRALDSSEHKFLGRRKLVGRHYEIGRSAVAVFGNSLYGDTCISYEKMKDILSIDDYKNSPNIIIENTNSAITQYLLKVFGITTFSKNVYAASTTNEILERLKKDVNSIAFVDWSKMSDSDDAFAKQIQNEFKLISIKRPKDSIDFGCVFPYQYNLQDWKYPFTRDIYFISRSGKNDLGLGFASFICSEIGQKILLKAGLLPKYQFERLIELKNEGVRVVE